MAGFWVSALVQILHVGGCEKGLGSHSFLDSSPPLPATHQSRSTRSLALSHGCWGGGRGMGEVRGVGEGVEGVGEQVRSVKGDACTLLCCRKGFFPKALSILSDKGSICWF